LRGRRGASLTAPLPCCNKSRSRNSVCIGRSNCQTREKSGASPSYQEHAVITKGALWFWSDMKKALTDPEGRQGLGDRLIPCLIADKRPANRLFTFAPIDGF